MNPHRIVTQAAQGDLLVTRVDRIPDGLTAVEAPSHVVAHSETGHHHVVTADVPLRYYVADPLTAYLEVGEGEAVLEHQRPYDTHEPYALGPGCYELRRQEEWAPEGWRQVED